MNTRNCFPRFPFAVMVTVALSVWLHPAMAADSPTQARLDMQRCKTYVREHHGHPGKGVDVVKTVDLCPKHG